MMKSTSGYESPSELIKSEICLLNNSLTRGGSVDVELTQLNK